MREFMYDFFIYICAWIATLILVGIGLSTVYLIMGLIKGALND
jgi:hypothetical protein